MKHTTSRRQRGITLIESLVAIIVAALGILGILGVQMRTLTDTQTTVRRAQAIRLIEDLSERLKVNPNAVAAMANYVSDFNNLPSPVSGSCASGCNGTDQAKQDLFLWKESVKVLPMGKANIFIPVPEAALPPEQRRQLGVMIAWRENERQDLSTTDKENTDATKVRDVNGIAQNAAGSAAACPADHTCHLQFIPISARCAPYKAGGGATQYFCPGA
ncbi:MAG: type IV pilus modification protein PilV [Proteobacteria bacterium]|nr:type IV pilus modification protein PilV [Pseudomonadota bacterium]